MAKTRSRKPVKKTAVNGGSTGVVRTKDPAMNTKQEIVKNWLPRYTGVALKDFGRYILLTNFDHYIDLLGIRTLLASIVCHELNGAIKTFRQSLRNFHVFYDCVRRRRELFVVCRPIA